MHALCVERIKHFQQRHLSLRREEGPSCVRQAGGAPGPRSTRGATQTSTPAPGSTSVSSVIAASPGGTPLNPQMCQRIWTPPPPSFNGI